MNLTVEKRKYTKSKTKENRTKIVTVLLTENEYEVLIEKAERSCKSISSFIREAINEKG